ncbi:UDP-glucosyltransferase 2-like [Pectinophora gossypiella]|uniref:UDP-glucosyltransferase 2-like n=1 Tax=Pectinophora gossypiella TaxID=13191 RepID=UPI00214EE201|nr:UDP-glucosyltransferase 2-like [Pectinophora gossypiella]
MWKLLLKAVLVFYFLGRIEAARILAVFPTPSISHQVVFRPLTQELAKRGHDVVVITTNPAFPKGETPANLTEVDIHDIAYNFWRSNFKVSKKGWKDDPVLHMTHATDLFARVFFEELKNKDFQRIIKEESFDLVFVEACARPAFVLSNIFKAPLILISSIGALPGLFNVIGSPTHPILYPSPLNIRLYNLTIWEKVTELYKHFLLSRADDLIKKYIDEMLKSHFGHDVPGIDELNNNIDMLFLNTHPILEDNRPVPPKVVYIWGLHKKPEKELPKDLQSYLDTSKNGVIYISFGTNVNPSMLPQKRMNVFITVLSQLPYDVLWKWDRDDELASNIRIEKWLPQSDLLRNPKIKLFITQGGLQSTDEAISAGVPLIGVPIIADQWYNTEKYVRHKIGIQVDFDTVTEDQFRNAVNAVIGDESYKHNVLHLRTLLSDQPQQPLERAVWWTEYVLRHSGARHLRAPAANISWTEYLMIDFFVSVLLVLLVAILVICKIFFYVLRVIFRSTKVKKS